MTCDRQNTFVFSFDIRSTRINAFQIHELLDETVQTKKDDVRVENYYVTKIICKIHIL